MLNISIFLLLIILVLIIGGLLGLYAIFYTRRINQKVREENSGGRLVDLPKMIRIAVIVLLAMLCVILIVQISTQNNETIISRNDCRVIDISEPEHFQYIEGYGGLAENRNASFAKMYSKEENPGYAKEVLSQGSFTFTVFKRTEPADNFHPDFLCYVDYTGNYGKDAVLSSSKKFSNEDGSFSASGLGELYDEVLYVGNLDPGCTFTISLSIFDGAGKDAFLEKVKEEMAKDSESLSAEKEYALESAEVEIYF